MPFDTLEAKLVVEVESVRRLTVLFNNLLDVTRIASGGFPVSRKTVELDAVVRAVVERIPDEDRERIFGGTIRVASTLGEGSTFVVELPRSAD